MSLIAMILLAQWSDWDWPMYKHDPARTGRGPAVGNFTDPLMFYVRWCDATYNGIYLTNAPSIVDVNKDGVWDIIFAIPVENTEGTLGALWINDGLDRWAHPFFFGACPATGWLTECGPVSGDIDRDGETEVVVYTGQGKLFVLRVGPDPSWNQVEFCYRLVDSASFSTTGTPYVSGSLACDLEGDGMIEIITGSALRENLWGAHWYGDTVFCFKALGPDAYALEWKRVYGDHYFLAAPAAADLDGDGDLEIVMVSFRGFVICIDHDGALRWSTQLSPDSSFPTPPVLGDLTGDGLPDVLIPRSNISVPGTGLWAFDAFGNLLWKYDSVQMSSPSLCDLDDDGAMDVLVLRFNQPYPIVALKGRDGSVLWRLSNGLIPNTRVPPQVFDVDGDGQEELLISCAPNILGSIRAFRTDGTLLWWFDIPINSTTGTPGTPIVCDFDGDGYGEIFTAGTSCRMAVIDADSSALPAGEAAAWPQSLISVEPRVFRGALRITLSLPEESQVELSLYDFTGRKIATVYEGTAKEKTITYDNPLKPGVYVLVLRGKGVYQKISVLRAP